MAGSGEPQKQPGKWAQCAMPQGLEHFGSSRWRNGVSAQSAGVTEQHEKNMTELRKKRESKLVLWIVLLGLLIFGVYILL